MRRKAQLSVEREPIETWQCVSPECPLLPHLTALGQKPRECTAGIVTNFQGAVPLKHCEFYTPNSYKGGKDDGTIECKKDVTP